MRLTLIGMEGAGKSFWSERLAEHGFKRFCCDDLIEAELASALRQPNGGTLSMGQWMGFPFEPDYASRETRYLDLEREVLTRILETLERRHGDPEEKIVVDTTGSVIYTGEPSLERLRNETTLVYLSVPPEVRDQLLEAYIAKPHPMLWRGSFHRASHETKEAALARCYARLVRERERLYERIAEVTIDYHLRRAKGFTVSDLLHSVGAGGRTAQP